VLLYAFSDLVSLGRSQSAYAFSVTAARVAVTASLGIGSGLLAAVVVVVFVRHPDYAPKRRPRRFDRPVPGPERPPERGGGPETT